MPTAASWKDLRQFWEPLNFKDSTLKAALKVAHGKAGGQWKKKVTDEHLEQWTQTLSERIRAQARAITQTSLNILMCAASARM